MPSNAEQQQNSTPKQHHSWLRRLAIALGAVILIVGILELIEWPFLRTPLQGKLTDALHREVQIGDDFGIRFIGNLRAHTNLFVIGPAPEGPQLDGQTPELLRATELKLSLPWSTVINLVQGELDQQPTVTRLEAEKLDAAFLRTADGESNWQFGEPKQAPEDESSPIPIPAFDRLAIADGQLRINDAASDLDLRVKLETLEGSSAETTSTADTAANEGVNTGLKVTAEGTYRGQDVRGNLTSSGLLALATSDQESEPVPLRFEIHAGATDVSFNGTARDVMHLGDINGEYEVAGPSLAAVGDTVGVTLPTTNAFSMTGQLRKEGEVWSTEVKMLEIGLSRLAGNFRYDPTPAVPKLTGKLGGQRLAILDLGPAVGTPPRPNSARAAIAPQAVDNDAVKQVNSSGVKAPARADSIAEAKRLGARRTAAASTQTAGKASTPKTASSRVLPQRDFDIPSLAAMDADVEVDLQEFNLGTPALDDFAPFRTHVFLDNQHLRLEDIVARTAGGEMRGRISLDAKPEEPQWEAELRWTDVDLAKFVQAKNVADDGTTSGDGYISGTLGGQMKVNGTGRSTAAMLASLDGSIQLWVRNGAISHFLVELAGIDVAQALGMLITGDDDLPMQCAVAALNVRDGSIAPQIAVVETSDSTMKIDGGISLADERLGLVLKTEPKDVSPISLRSPVYIEGSFANPEVRLDKTGIGLRVVAAAALAAVTPAAALLALVDFGEPEKKACEDAIVRAQGSEAQRVNGK